MKALKTKSLYAAVIAGLGAAGSMQAGAVNISQDNTGQVLLYPYYTTRNGFVTSLTVVNTDQEHFKVAKVRFLEGKNSAEVLDFNLFLSPRDVWTASVVDNGSGAAILTTDRSCTVPAIGATNATAQPFVNYYYTGAVGGATFYDNGGQGLDRTREGYIEIIEMGVVANGADTESSPATPVGNTVATAVKHGAAGSPANCNVVRVATGLFPGAGDLNRPAGGLMGSGIIINATSGTEFAYNPVALANFFFDPAITTDLYSDSGNLNPDLRNVTPARSDVFVEGTGGVPAILSVLNWAALVGPPAGQNVDAVSAILMRSAIMNEYDVSTGFKTDWVITAPTKRYYVQAASAAAAALAATTLTNTVGGPFHTTFASATANNAQSCDQVYPAAYDREEAPYAQAAGVVFSPVPAGGAAGVGTLCFESTVMTVVPNGGTVAAASVFGSANAASLTLPANGTGTPVAPNYTSGWIALHPTRSGTLASGATIFGPGQHVTAGTVAVGTGSVGIPIASITAEANGGLRSASITHTDAVARRYRGLPVIGFAAIQAVLGGQGYGGIFDHKYARSIN